MDRRRRTLPTWVGSTALVSGLGRGDEIPHARLIRGVVIVRTEDAGRVVGWLKEMGAEVQVGTVALAAADLAALRA